MKKNNYLLLLFSLFLFFPVNAQDINGTWKGKLQAGSQTLSLVLHIDTAQKEVKMDVPQQGAKDLPMVVTLLTQDSIDVGIPQAGIHYVGVFKNGIISGMFTQYTFVASVDFERGEVKYNRPQEPLQPYPYTTEEVSFKNGDVILSGTLTYPAHHQAGKRVPVVLMITGSGPQNRDEELFNHKPFLVLADWLARHGIASLRYDDRGVGQSTGQFASATTFDFAEDASAGITFLRQMKKFSRIGILGHSEGGIIAYVLGSRREPDFIVSLAGPACRIDSMMLAQVNLLGRSQGLSSDLASTVEDAKALLTKDGNSNKWFEEFFKLDMRPYVKAVRCPVMALGGETDLNVPVSINVPALEQNLRKNKSNIIKVYPGLSHLFHHNPTGNPMKAIEVEETISPDVLQDISDWILER